MLSLFDSDGGFLDELTVDNNIAGAPMMDAGNAAGGMMGQNNMQMNQVMNSQPQQPQMYNQQMGTMPPNQFNSIQMQPTNMPQQNQFMTNNFSQGQFNTNKLHHFGGPVQQQQQQPGAAPQIMLLQQNPQQQPQMQVVGTNMPQSSGFPNYGGMTSATGPRLPNPHQQQVGMQQNVPRMWNQNGPSQFVQQQMPNQQTQIQGMPHQMSGNGLQTTYLTQPSYALQEDNNIPQNRYPVSMTSTPNANAFMQGMKSPPSNMRPNVPMSSPNNIGNAHVSNINQSPRPSQQMMINRNSSFQTQQNINSGNIPNFSASQPQQTFQNNFNVPNVPNVGQINAGNASVPNSSFQQQFTFQHQKQQVQNQNSVQGGMQMSQNVNDSVNVVPFQNTSPNQTVQFRPGYAGAPQRTNTPTASPRPSPSPARTPDQNTSPNSQGNQLVSPTLVTSRGNTPAASSPFHPSSTNSTSQSQLPVGISNSGNVPVNSSQSIVGPNQGISISVNANVNNVSQMSPNVSQAKNVNVEVYQLQQQIQQLHNQPQTQQTQQQMLDLQERVRTLRAQQELNNQRQKQQPQPQQFQQYQPAIQPAPAGQQQPAIIQVQQAQMQPRQQIVQIQQPFPNQQQQPIQAQGQPSQGQRILLVSNNAGGQPQRFFQATSQAQGPQFQQQPQQQKVLFIQVLQDKTFVDIY